MDGHPQNDWGSVRYDARFDEYWVPAGNAQQLLFFCPWCGERLPESQRDRWFDELEAKGLDPLVDPVPDDYRTGAWRGATDTESARTHQHGGPVEGRVLNFFDSDDEDSETRH